MQNIIILKPFLPSVISKATEACWIICLKEADSIILQQTAIEKGKLSLVSTHSLLSYYNS